ncbi:MAG: hypothetical protein NT139_01150 [Candidatus Woesearchaeota archaeon]|nr:hypothetical protein [Candidatus Woesearchaeota archaeon]
MESPQNQNINLDNEIVIRQPLDKKAYAKKYYDQNKEKMKLQTREAFKKMECSDIKRNKVLEKLNTNGFKRIPLKILTKHNIIFSEELKKYI